MGSKYIKNAFLAGARPQTHFRCIQSPGNVSNGCKNVVFPIGEPIALPYIPLLDLRGHFQAEKREGKRQERRKNKGTGENTPHRKINFWLRSCLTEPKMRSSGM